MKFLPDEHIIWEGKSNHELKLKVIKKNAFDKLLDVISFIERLWYAFIVLILIVLVIMKLIDLGELLASFASTFLLIAILIVWYYKREKEESKVKFVITNKRFLFYSWGIFKGHKLDVVDFSSVEKMSIEEYENNVGTIYIMGRQLGSFKNTAHYPALVAIEKAKEVKVLIEKYL